MRGRRGVCVCVVCVWAGGKVACCVAVEESRDDSEMEGVIALLFLPGRGAPGSGKRRDTGKRTRRLTCGGGSGGVWLRGSVVKCSF